jgi:hypothetical protein
MCCAWSVSFATAQTWTSLAGDVAEFVTGRCEKCGTRVLTDPSRDALAQAAVRLAAMRTAVSRMKDGG